MELLQLKYFLKVAQTKHLTQAANELHITQPALSQTIAKLEKDLGLPLFERDGRKIRLNPYGEVFLEKVKIALHALEEGQREIADMAGLERGRISLDTTFLPHFPKVLNDFLQKYPDVQFHISQASNKEMKTQLLLEGEIDFCISCYAIEQKGVNSLPIQTEEIVLVVPTAHRFAGKTHIRLREAAEEPFIVFKKEHQFRQTTDELCQLAGFTPKAVCETDESKTVIEFVRSGLGVALLPESVLEQNAPVHRLYIKEPVCQRTYYLCWKEQRYLSKAARTFRDFLIGRLGPSSPSFFTAHQLPLPS